MHPIVARLVLSMGTAGLAACAEGPSGPPGPTSPMTFAELRDVAPDVVSDAFAGSRLESGSVPISDERCQEICGPQAARCEVNVQIVGDPDRPMAASGSFSCIFPHHEGGSSGFLGLGSCPFGCGRRPSSGSIPPSGERDPLLAHVSEIALLEAISIGAFAQLAVDLESHAPSLASRALRAQGDELRHARHARVLLRALGGRPRRAPAVTLVNRNLEEAALENATEGCVHETFGAIALGIQAARARNPALRHFFQRIARDEMDHATLSWDVHDALAPRLGRRARASIGRRQMAELDRIESMAPLPIDLHEDVGAPSPTERAKLVAEMRLAVLTKAAH